MGGFINAKRRMIVALLAVVGIADMAWYSYCGGSCRAVAGKIAGMDLNYIGIAFMAVALILIAIKREKLLALALAAAAGGEAFLVGYQIATGKYCYYCLLFGAAIIAMLVLSWARGKKWHMAIAASAGLAAMLLFFTGAPQVPMQENTYARAEAGFRPAYGTGKIEVRFYTDYFCGPCHATEPKAMPALEKLVKAGKIRLAFVDTPIHEQSQPYAMLFIYAVSARQDFQSALAARSALFRAARAGVTDNRELVKRIIGEGVPLAAVNVNKVWATNAALLQEDGIERTPSMTIIRDGRKNLYTGGKDIIKAVDELAKG